MYSIGFQVGSGGRTWEYEWQEQVYLILSLGVPWRSGFKLVWGPSTSLGWRKLERPVALGMSPGAPQAPTIGLQHTELTQS